MENVFRKIYETNAWNAGKGESRSGRGAIDASTDELRPWLRRVLKAFRVETFLDIPCGEWGYMRLVDFESCHYVGGDIVREVVSLNQGRFPGRDFRHLDLTKDPLPRADLVLVKDCFQHLPNDAVVAALRNLERSGSPLLCTSSDAFPWPISNDARPTTAGGCVTENLSIAPFRLGALIATCKLDRKFYSLWRLDGPATDEDRLRFGATLRESMAECVPSLPLLEDDATVHSRTVVLGRIGDQVSVQALGRGYASPGDETWIPAPGAALLAAASREGALVRDLHAAFATKHAIAREDVHHFLWLAAQLELVRLSALPSMDRYQSLQAIRARATSNVSDALGIRTLAGLLHAQPEWVRAQSMLNDPPATLLSMALASGTLGWPLETRPAADGQVAVTLTVPHALIAEVLALWA